ncbi:MAG: uroporphyrinogen decarboxylase [Sphingomonadales bacterium]
MNNSQPDTASRIPGETAPLLSALDGTVNDRPPFWFMRQAGRYLPEYREVRGRAGNFLDLCYCPDLAAEVTLQPVERFSTDAAILFADILLVPHAMGQTVSFEEGRGPVLEPVKSVADIEALALDRLHEKLRPVYETVRLVSKSLAENKVLIGFAGAPWTVATYMVEGGTSRDHFQVRRWALRDRDGFGLLVEKLIDATSAYLIRQVESGARVLQIFDTWSGVLAEPAFRRWCIEPTREIVARVRAKCPKTPIIGFPRGAGPLYRDYVLETGVDGVSIDTSLPVTWAADKLQKHATVQGNLDPAALVEGGAVLRGEAKRILEALGDGPHIFNLGHGIVPQTPPEHVAELCDLLLTWRRGV